MPEEAPFCSALAHILASIAFQAPGAELPSYRLAALDQDFILGDSAAYASWNEKVEEALRAWGILSTIVVFGSAR
jgi:hypothetical protein